MKKDLFKFRNKLEEKTVAIIGGGDSRFSDVKNLPDECILIGANHYGVCDGLPIKYMVFQDLPVYKKFKACKSKGVKVVSKYPDISHILIRNTPRGLPYAGMLAAYVGLMLTTGPVILCGMDCYYHDEGFPHEKHLEYWNHLNKNNYGFNNPERIKAMSGPLISIFGKWESK